MQVVMNADDFGCSGDINAAVILAHQQGVLTSASLMVTGDAVDEAVALAHATPTLAVGLHVVLVGGRSLLGHKELPHLVDHTGRFPDDPLAVGLRYVFSRAARSELSRELAAQFERFAATGLALTHVDGHLNFHLHPVVFSRLLPLARQYGARGLRLPRDDLALALSYDRHLVGTKIGWAAAFALLCRWNREQLRKYTFAVAHRVYGLLQSGHMDEAYVVRLLQRLRTPTAELYFHPSTAAQARHLGPNPGDLATLLSPSVRRIIQERNLRLATYATLGEML